MPACVRACVPCAFLCSCVDDMHDEGKRLVVAAAKRPAVVAGASASSASVTADAAAASAASAAAVGGPAGTSAAAGEEAVVKLEDIVSPIIRCKGVLRDTAGKRVALQCLCVGGVVVARASVGAVGGVLAAVGGMF